MAWVDDGFDSLWGFGMAWQVVVEARMASVVDGLDWLWGYGMAWLVVFRARMVCVAAALISFGLLERYRWWLLW